jgi:hypothetical protein
LSTIKLTHELLELQEELEDGAHWRGHETLTEEIFNPDHLRMTCVKCGLDADANTRPLANEITIGGPLIALNCGDPK